MQLAKRATSMAYRRDTQSRTRSKENSFMLNLKSFSREHFQRVRVINVTRRRRQTLRRLRVIRYFFRTARQDVNVVSGNCHANVLAINGRRIRV